MPKEPMDFVESCFCVQTGFFLSKNIQTGLLYKNRDSNKFFEFSLKKNVDFNSIWLVKNENIVVNQ